MSDRTKATERAERLFKTAELAARLSMSPEAIYELIDHGRLRPVKLGRRVFRFAESDVCRLIRESRS